jgi:hypothetical protein
MHHLRELNQMETPGGKRIRVPQALIIPEGPKLVCRRNSYNAKEFARQKEHSILGAYKRTIFRSGTAKSTLNLLNDGQDKLL